MKGHNENGKADTCFHHSLFTLCTQRETTASELPILKKGKFA